MSIRGESVSRSMGECCGGQKAKDCCGLHGEGCAEERDVKSKCAERSRAVPEYSLVTEQGMCSA